MLDPNVAALKQATLETEIRLLRQQLATVTNERDELATALNMLLNDVGRSSSMLGAVAARAAIAKLGAGKGEK